MQEQRCDHRPVAVLVFTFADPRPDRVGGDDRAGKQRVGGSDAGVDDADDGGAGDWRENVGETVRAGVVELGHGQCWDRQHVDACDDIELSKVVYGARREVDPGEQDACCVVDVAISDVPTAGFDGAAEVVEPLLCQVAVVGMPALDVETKRGGRVGGLERGPQRRGEPVGRLEGA